MFERFGESALAAVTQAQLEADRLRHNYVGTEHLLLALLGAEDGVAARVLLRLGLGVERARTSVVRIIGLGPLREPDGAALGTIGIDLQSVRQRAEEAFGRGALERTRAARDRRVVACGRGSRWPRRGHGEGAMPLTPRAKKVLQLAAAEATRFGDRLVRSEHVLLALLREGDGVASEILARGSITYRNAHDQVMQERYGS